MSRTLAGRVARAMVLSAALGATLTAGVANELAWRWTLAREDARLRAAAETLVRELGTRAPGAEADDEDLELRPSGIRIALFAGREPVGGARTLAPAPLGCGVAEMPGGSHRRCAMRHAPWTVVTAAPYAPLTDTRLRGALSSFVAVVLASLAAGLAGRAAGARTVGPLARLRASLAGLRAEAPDPTALSPAEGYAEVDALREVLADLLGRHAQALTRTRRFAADAAHELRTPLGTMRAELELVLERTDLSPETAAAIERVRAKSVAMGTLAERLLLLASPLEGRVGGEAVALGDLATTAVEARQCARLVLHLDDEGMVRGDAALLRALLDNALDNALKFAPTGALRVEVTRIDERVVLRVADEGPGVPAASRATVFAPFHRTAGARAAGASGHGVGLALVAHITQAHKGIVRFEDPPRGAVLRVELPAWRENPPPR